MKIKVIKDKYLLEYKSNIEKIDNLYYVKKDEFSKDWIEKKKIVAKSFLALYKFSNKLLLNKKNRSYFFYMDTNLSTIRNSIYTETPKTEVLDILTPYIRDDIAYTAERLKEYDDEELFDIDYIRFSFKIFLMYNFIYYRNEGVFTRFELNKQVFNKVKEVFKFDKNFRMFGLKLINEFLKEHIKAVENKNIDNPYEYIVKKAKNNEVILIEPLSYFLAYKIWRIAKIIKNAPHFLDNEEREKLKIKYYDDLKNNFIRKNLILIEKFYENKISNIEMFKEMIKVDKTFIENVMDDFLIKYKDNPIKKIDFNFQKNKKIKPKNIESILNNCIDVKKYEKYKFNRLLEKLEVSVDDITYLVEILTKELEITNENIIAIGRGGLLITHMVNVIKNLYKNVFVYTSYPLVSIYPRSLKLENSTSFIFDESIKSGFNLESLLLYKKRVFDLYYKEKENKNYCFFSVVEFPSFGRIKSHYIKTLAKIDIKKDEIKNEYSKKIEVKRNDSLNEIFDWKSYFNELDKEKYNLFDFVKIKDNRNRERIDISRLFANSVLYFYIGNKFADEIKKFKDDTIYLTAGSFGGKWLVDLIAFVYKAKYNDKTIVIDTDEVIKNKEKGVVFVDLSIDSGFSLKRSFKIDFNDNDFKYLKKAFVIFIKKDFFKKKEYIKNLEKEKIFFLEEI